MCVDDEHQDILGALFLEEVDRLGDERERIGHEVIYKVSPALQAQIVRPPGRYQAAHVALDDRNFARLANAFIARVGYGLDRSRPVGGLGCHD